MDWNCGNRLITELPAWDRLLKKIVWEQLGDVAGLKILDFGSGEGITACHFARKNEVTAVEPWTEMLKNAWNAYEYRQVVGDISALASIPDETFDLVICHNVLEYIDNKEFVVRELTRVLKKSGAMSIVKHNRAGRIMQMAVLLDSIEKANALLSGGRSETSKFGDIRYYEDTDLVKWAPDLLLTRTFGIRTFWDLQQNQEKHSQEDWQLEMMQLEMRVSEIDEFRNVAFFHHLILRKQ